MDTNKLILDSFNKALELNGQNIKLMDKDKNIKAMTKAIVKSERVQNQDSNYFISVGDVYKITTLEKTNIGDLISFKNKQYKVESVDDTSPLYKSYCKYNGIDIVYNIILAENSTTINKDNTYQITATCTQNSVSVENPSIIYTSSSDAIATVNASGLVTGISEGECTINCNYNGVSATLTVNVIAQSQGIEYYIDTSNTAIKRYNISEVTAMKIIDGSKQDTSANLSFSFTPPTGATITTQTDGSYATIKIKNLKGYIEGTYPLILLEDGVEVARVDITFIN